MAQTPKQAVEILSTTILSTGVLNEKIPLTVRRKIDEPSIYSKLPYKLKPFKGLPWSLFTEDDTDKSISNAIPQPNATTQIPTSGIMKNRSFVQLPSNWKLQKITSVETADIIKSMKRSISSSTINNRQPSMTPDHARIVVDPGLIGITKMN